MALVAYANASGSESEPEPDNASPQVPERRKVAVKLTTGELHPVAGIDDQHAAKRQRIAQNGEGKKSGLFALLPEPKSAQTARTIGRNEQKLDTNGKKSESSNSLPDDRSSKQPNTTFIPKSAGKRETEKLVHNGSPTGPGRQKINLFPVGEELNIPRVRESEADPNFYKPITERPRYPEPEKVTDNDASANSGLQTQSNQGWNEADQELIAKFGSKRDRIGNGKGSDIKIVDFNVREQYESNETARVSGELSEMPTPLRAIAPGRHSLTQLLNVVHAQKDKYEEHFAQGVRNRRESRKQYGF